MARLGAGVELPVGRAPLVEPGSFGAGIVHLGLGAFHRAHQAVYTEAAMACSGGDWGIVGVAPRSRDIVEALNAQDLLFSVVTLGGTGFQRGKRHPTIEDNVTIGSGAKLLGPITVGHGAKVGANTVVVTDVPERATVVGNPGHIVRVEGKRPEGPDTDWIHLPDPVADAIKTLSERLTAIEQRLSGLDGGEADAEVHELRPKHGPTTAGG